MTRNDVSSMDPTQAPGHEFLKRVRRSALSVLGESPAGREVHELCDEHAEARRLICDDRSRGLTVIAVVGATGQGKSWIIQQLLRRSSTKKMIRSGNNHDEATEKVLWVGPFPPADLDSRYEEYVACSASGMQPIGTPYLLVDSPGSTDDRPVVAAAAKRALSLASILLLVVRRDQLRSQTVAITSEASEGTVVIPVVNCVRRDETLNADVEAFTARIRQAAPTSKIAPVVLVDDFDVAEQEESLIGQTAAEQIGACLEEELSQSWEGDRRRSTRLAALDARFRAALHSVLRDHLPELTGAITRLHREADALPGEVAQTLVGNSGSLRAAVRSSLRLGMLSNTAAFWFPYRSQLGLLNLTHGAWDRVLLSLSGSLPSLISTVWTTTKNLTSDKEAGNDVREGLKNRSTAAVADRLGPLAENFHRELLRLRHPEKETAQLVPDVPHREQVASLSGIDTLQEQSQRIFEDEVERAAVSRGGAMIGGLIGTAIFWTLMSGPVVALYSNYFDASYHTLSGLDGDLSKFPHPDFSMMLTSLILSLLPTSIFAMIALSIAQAAGKVKRVELAIRERHRETILQLQRTGVLRLQWDEPLLADAEFLLSAGASDAEPGSEHREDLV